MDSLKSVLPQLSEKYMLLMDHPSIRGQEITDYAQKATCNILHTYIDAHIKISFDECTGDGVQAI